jgi:trans-aconitate methyltransferase
MSFEVSSGAYGAFMGVYAEPLAGLLADFAEVEPDQLALDVGCGPGTLTTELVRRLGAAAVSAIDPSESFVAATRARLPEVSVRGGVAEHLPYDSDAFDVTLAQLVVHFMSDPVAGMREMARVTRTGGALAACVWDHAGNTGPLSLFWDAVRELDPTQPGEAVLAGSREGHLAELAAAAGWTHIDPDALTVEVPFATLDAWWDRFTLGVGPAGAYVATLDEDARTALRTACASRLPEPPFVHTATAWAVRGRAR